MKVIKAEQNIYKEAMENYSIQLALKTEAKLEYVAMMADITIPQTEEENTYVSEN